MEPNRGKTLPTALVTGANGFIGSHLVELLTRQSCKVRCLVRKTSDLRWIRDSGVERAEGDLADVRSLERAVDGADWVFHLAGKTKALSRDEFFKANAGGTENLLSACRAGGTLRRFVYVSSMAASGPGPDGRPVRETDPPRPVTWYGESKLEGEKAVFRHADRLPVVVIRPPVVFGPRDTDVLRFFQSVARGVVPLVGFRKTVCGFSYVEDLAAGLALAVEHPKAVGGTFYMTNEPALAWTDFGKMAGKALGIRTVAVPVPLILLTGLLLVNEAAARIRRRPTILNLQKLPEYRERSWGCDGSRAVNELGYSPSFPLPAAVEKTIAWYRSAGWI
jgi:nucleoside-diphosphate-sugar epimerase